jgi:plastocyanin
VLLLVLAAGCLPQVGPPLDGGAGGGTGGALTGGGGGALTGGGGGSTGGGGGGSMTGGGGGSIGPSCGDGVHNGLESDVDCGGPCVACGLNSTCGTSVDCASGVCSAGHCVVPNDVCGAAFAGCSTFVDLRDAGTAVIQYGVGGNRFTPACALVQFGQSVRFEGSGFSQHTLGQGCGPTSGLISAGSGTTATFTFDRALGVYGFYCMQHGSSTGSGMSGAIEVVR